MWFCITLIYPIFYCGQSLKDKLQTLQKEEKFEEMLLLCLSEKETQDTKKLCELATEKPPPGSIESFPKKLNFLSVRSQ